MPNKKLHSVAYPMDYSVVYRTAPFVSTAKWVLDEIEGGRLADKDILYIVPASSRYTPDVKDRHHNQLYRAVINDGSTIRSKKGTLVLLLNWLVDEAAQGRVGDDDGVFVTIADRKMPWEVDK